MNREERDQAITDIVQTIGGFIRRDFDHLTAKRYWDHVIASTPPDILTEALIRALCSGAYQERCPSGMPGNSRKHAGNRHPDRE
ncbi:hypothetical protein [Laribacter hongkongensis]|nr:hypothetical protein [Laribacter hongkongensis]